MAGNDDFDWSPPWIDSNEDRFTPLTPFGSADSFVAAPAFSQNLWENISDPLKTSEAAAVQAYSDIMDVRFDSSAETLAAAEKHKKYKMKYDPCANAATYEDYLRNRRAIVPRTKKSEDWSREKWEALCLKKGEATFKKAPAGKLPAVMLDPTYAQYVARQKKNNKIKILSQQDWYDERLKYAQKSGSKFQNILDAEAQRVAAAAVVAARPPPTLSRIDGVWKIDDGSGLIDKTTGTTFLPFGPSENHKYKKLIDLMSMSEYEDWDLFLNLNNGVTRVRERDSGEDFLKTNLFDDILDDILDEALAD
jgi:hypothetical protein